MPTISLGAVFVMTLATQPAEAPVGPVEASHRLDGTTGSSDPGTAPRASTADPFLKPPKHRGKWLVITGGVATASLLVTRVAFSGVILHSGLCYTSDNIDACEEDYSDLLAMFADGLTVPGFAISLGLLGGGLAWMGRWRAYEDLSLRRPLRRRMKLREHLGWGLLGAGLATWAVGMGVGWHCNDVRNAPCFLGVHEGLFYAGAGLTGAGVGLAAFAHGYNRQLRDTKVDAVRVMPTFGRDYAGLSLAGRF